MQVDNLGGKRLAVATNHMTAGNGYYLEKNRAHVQIHLLQRTHNKT